MTSWLRQTKWNGEWFCRFLKGQEPFFVKRKLRPYSLYFPQNTLMLTDSREEFSDLHSIFRVCGLRYFPWLKFLVEIGVNDVIFSKILHGLKLSWQLVQQFARRRTKVLAPGFVQFSTFIVIIISIRAVFLRIWRHFLQFSTKNWNKEINGGRRFTEIKVQKTCVLYFVIDWNLARCAGKTYCVQKCKKCISNI